MKDTTEHYALLFFNPAELKLLLVLFLVAFVGLQQREYTKSIKEVVMNRKVDSYQISRIISVLSCFTVMIKGAGIVTESF